MDNERDGPFEVGDRVMVSFAEGDGDDWVDHEGTYLGLDRHGNPKVRPCNMALLNPTAKADGRDYEKLNLHNLTLISRAPKPEKEYKVGDRLVDKEPIPDFRPGWFATIVEVETDSCSLVWTEPNGEKKAPTSWLNVSIAEQLVKLTTEPMAQEETEMQAYFWIAWKKDEDGKRVSLVGSETEMWMVVAANEADARRKADFKLAETLELETPDDLLNYEVQVVPFGG